VLYAEQGGRDNERVKKSRSYSEICGRARWRLTDIRLSEQAALDSCKKKERKQERNNQKAKDLFHKTRTVLRFFSALDFFFHALSQKESPEPRQHIANILSTYVKYIYQIHH